MRPAHPDKISFLQPLKYLLFVVLFLSSCTIVRKEQKGKPIITKNNIEVKGGKFTKDEQIALKSRLNTQLDDSAKINVVDKLFFWHIYNKPAAFDTAYAAQSARNMASSMLHLGYYRAGATYKADTSKKTDPAQVTVHYTVQTGKLTLIDSVQYRLSDTSLQQLTMAHLDDGLLQKGAPVTKAAVLGEIARLVDLYRNNGYYKITSEEIKVRGDTTLEALTSISDDPFEQLRLLAEAQQKKDSPKIKLAVVLNPPADKRRLQKYYINNIYILPDYQPGDRLDDPSLTERVTKKELYVIIYHHKLYRTSFLLRNMYIKKGDLYSQAKYYQTLNSLTRMGVWQSVNIEMTEPKDSSGKIDMVVQLISAKQFVREASVEASYSANSNTNNITTVNAGNLLGVSTSVSLTNRNLNKEAIKWTNSIRAGMELNLKPESGRRNIINSNELGYSSTAVIPRFILLPKKLLPKKLIKDSLGQVAPQTFANLGLSYINRINLYNLQSANLGFGYSFHNRKKGEWKITPINVEFTRLYNQTPEFEQTLLANPFLQYSFNTALVAGNLNVSYAVTTANPKNRQLQHTFKTNLEESGLLFHSLHLFDKYLRKFIKLDIDYTHSRSRPKSAFIIRGFLGAGVPLAKDTALPFFKQYFGGGTNSMRGWPVRGIGRGSQPLAPYDNNNKFNDRTGDLQFETNLEYRFNIAQLIPNTMLLKGALFIDAGNIWNLRNTKPSGVDSAQFQLKNFWRDMGINAGTGFRLDFNYFVVRFDFGFRFKRPEQAYINNGWKVPSLGFNDVFQKVFTRQYREWRYENFNFTIGVGYPF